MTDRTAQIANLLINPQLAVPPFDLVGPTVDDDIRRAISRYGAEAVKAATKRQTSAKIGRPKINDWNELHAILEEDAILWLKGGDPFTKRSNYAIAKTLADNNPGQSHPATMKRIQRKLNAAPFGRKWRTLVIAWVKSEKHYPYSDYVRVVTALSEIDHYGNWKWNLERAQGALNDYSAKFGSPPTNFSLSEIEEGARKPLNALLTLDRRRRGLFGLAGQSPAGASIATRNLVPGTSKD